MNKIKRGEFYIFEEDLVRVQAICSTGDVEFEYYGKNGVGTGLGSYCKSYELTELSPVLKEIYDN